VNGEARITLELVAYVGALESRDTVHIEARRTSRQRS
jgi:hypothetical protein